MMFEEGTFSGVVRALPEDVVSGRSPWSMWKRVNVAGEFCAMHEWLETVRACGDGNV